MSITSLPVFEEGRQAGKKGKGKGKREKPNKFSLIPPLKTFMYTSKQARKKEGYHHYVDTYLIELLLLMFCGS